MTLTALADFLASGFSTLFLPQDNKYFLSIYDVSQLRSWGCRVNGKETHRVSAFLEPSSAYSLAFVRGMGKRGELSFCCHS